MTECGGVRLCFHLLCSPNRIQNLASMAEMVGGSEHHEMLDTPMELKVTVLDCSYECNDKKGVNTSVCQRQHANMFGP